MNVRKAIKELLSPASLHLYWERVGYTPHPGQVDFHESQARFKTLTCGRRFGKTVAGVRDIGPLVYIPDTFIWVVGPTHGLALKEFRIFRRDLMRLERGGYLKLYKNIYDAANGRYFLQVHNGATIEVRSQEKEDQMVGEGLTGIILAEVARLKPHIWTELLRPTLTDYHGVARFATTPRGRNWYYDLVEAAKGNREWATFHKPSWANPVVYPLGREDPEIIELERTTPRLEFAQEYAAEFTSHAGLVYDEFDVDVHVRELDLLPDVPVTGWVDVGFSDPFVCLAVQVPPQGPVRVLDEYYRERMTPSEHAEVMREWFVRSGGIGVIPEVLYCDPRSPDGIRDLKREGWAAKAAPALDRRRNVDNPVIVGVKKVKQLLREQPFTGQPGILIHPRCKMTIKEFGLYEWINDEPDPKKNNHCVDAIRYGVLSEVARDVIGISSSDEENDADAILGTDDGCAYDSGEWDDYDDEESFMMQRLRQRKRERERLQATGYREVV